MCRPVRQFPEVVWTKQITVVLSVQRIVIVFTSTCKNKRTSKHNLSTAATATMAELVKWSNFWTRRARSYSATGPTACTFSILVALHSGSTGQCRWRGPLSAGEKPDSWSASRGQTALWAYAARLTWVDQGGLYVKDGLVLLLLFWFGLPRPCRTTSTSTILSRHQVKTAAATTETGPYWVFDSCQVSLLRVCPLSSPGLRWFWWNRVAKQGPHLQQHHVDSPVFLRICWTAAALRRTEEWLEADQRS